MKQTAKAKGDRNRTRHVATVAWRGPLKLIRLAGQKRRLVLPRSACVSKGDAVTASGAAAWIECVNGRAMLLPIYCEQETVRIGGLTLTFMVKEITDEVEQREYESLAATHYRGHQSYGRVARLILRNVHPVYPPVIGYVELATPLYMCKPRTKVLDRPFSCGAIRWERWDMASQRRNIHVITRIARCVVHPEFRGLGLGKALIQHAAHFARDHWQVAGIKPHFLEISADMLKFIPFAAHGGMRYVGDTEGNLHRVAKDMEYLLTNRKRVRGREIVREEACGIVDQQVARMTQAARLLRRQGWKLPNLIERLQSLSIDSALRDFNILHGLVSLPKPTYLLGLTRAAQQFLDSRAGQTVNPAIQPEHASVRIKKLSRPIVLREVSVVFSSSVRRTRRTHTIQQAFGLSPDALRHTVISKLSVKLNPGEVVLLTGPSGSGKTTLLRLLQGLPRAGTGIGRISAPHDCRPAMFTAIYSTKPLIEVFSRQDVGRTLHLLGKVGLSDAFVCLKRFNELSNGQQYRASLADLILANKNLWLADEFCATLDALTANAVADRLQKTAREMGATLVVASAQPEVIVHALQPDKVIRMTSAFTHEIIDGRRFARRLQHHRRVDAPRRFQLSNREFRCLREKGSCSITSRNAQTYVGGDLAFACSGRHSELVHVAEEVRSGINGTGMIRSIRLCRLLPMWDGGMMRSS